MGSGANVQRVGPDRKPDPIGSDRLYIRRVRRVRSECEGLLFWRHLIVSAPVWATSMPGPKIQVSASQEGRLTRGGVACVGANGARYEKRKLKS